MPKELFPKKRYNDSGHAHGLTCSCYRNRQYFADSNVCSVFLDELSRTRDKEHLKIWAYVLMPDHVHVLVWPRDPVYDIADIQKGLNGRMAKRYARFLREQHPSQYERLSQTSQGKPVFRFWQRGGGYDRNLWSGRAVHGTIQYIEQNPVRAGFVEKASDWPYSSAHARAGKGGLVPDLFQMPVLMK